MPTTKTPTTTPAKKPTKPAARAVPKRKNTTAPGLTELERRFALQYLLDFNATEAYIRASTNKVTRTAARANGHRALQRPEVQELIRAERDRLLAGAELTIEQTLEKLRQCLMYDARKAFNQKTGALLPMEEWPEDVAMAVVGVKDTMAGREIKFVDRVAALEKAMKYHGLFDKDNKQKGEAISEVLFRFVAPGGKVEAVPG